MNEEYKWVTWRYGWGEDLRIKGLPAITVAKSTTRGEDFYYSFGDIRSKPVFKSIEDAKAKVEERVRCICEHALSVLSKPLVPSGAGGVQGDTPHANPNK